MTSRSRSTMRHAANIVALTALVLATGCSLTRQSVVKETFLLDPTYPAAVAKTQSGSLRVGAVNVAAPYRGRNFVIRDTELKYEADFYREFFVPPGVMIADSTARSLSVAKVFSNVARPGVAVDTDWLLDGFVGQLYADMRDPAKPGAIMQVTYYLSRDNGGVGPPVWSQGYRKRVPFSATTGEGYITALSTAFSEILADMARDLAAVDLPKP